MEINSWSFDFEIFRHQIVRKSERLRLDKDIFLTLCIYLTLSKYNSQNESLAHHEICRNTTRTTTPLSEQTSVKDVVKIDPDTSQRLLITCDTNLVKFFV